MKNCQQIMQHVETVLNWQEGIHLQTVALCFM